MLNKQTSLVRYYQGPTLTRVQPLTPQSKLPQDDGTISLLVYQTKFYLFSSFFERYIDYHDWGLMGTLKYILLSKRNLTTFKISLVGDLPLPPEKVYNIRKLPKKQARKKLSMFCNTYLMVYGSRLQFLGKRVPLKRRYFSNRYYKCFAPNSFVVWIWYFGY